MVEQLEGLILPSAVADLFPLLPPVISSPLQQAINTEIPVTSQPAASSEASLFQNPFANCVGPYLLPAYAAPASVQMDAPADNQPASAPDSLLENPYANCVGPYRLPAPANPVGRVIKPLNFSGQAGGQRNTSFNQTMENSQSGGEWELTAIEGSDSASMLLAIFDNPESSGGSWNDSGSTYDGHVFLATIDWGDGSDPETGYIVFNSDTNQFEVFGNHTYNVEGFYTISVSLKEDGNSQNSATPGILVMNPGENWGGSSGGSGGFLTEADYDTGSVLLATFDNPDSGGSGGDGWDGSGGIFTRNGNAFKADVDWGDGTDADIGNIGSPSSQLIGCRRLSESI